MCMLARLFGSLLFGVGCMACPSIGWGAQVGKFQLTWQELPPLPVAVEGAFVGNCGGVLIVAGGRTVNYDESASGGQDHDTIFVLQPGDTQWTPAGNLPEPLAYGAAVETSRGLLCVGGITGSKDSAQALLIRWDSQANRTEISPAPDLPEPLAMCSATRLGNLVYVAGSGRSPLSKQATKNCFWSIELSSTAPKWTSHSAWPGEGIHFPALVSQSGELYLIGGANSSLLDHGSNPLVPTNAVYRYSPTSDTWQGVTDLPPPLVGGSVIAFGPSTIFYIGGLAEGSVNRTQTLPPSSSVRRSVLTYETITDTWCERAETEFPVALATAVEWQGKIVIVGGRSDENLSSTRVVSGTQVISEALFQWSDYSVLCCYFVFMLCSGWYFSGEENTSSDFLLGGRKIPWWAAGVSIMATQVSTIGFMAIPAKSYMTDWVYFTGVLTWGIVVPLVVRFYLPFFCRPEAVTAYEYLEHRFNLLARLYGSSSFVILQLGRMAVVLYLPAIALSVVTGLSVYASILAMGILTTVYTVMGGMRAVVWADIVEAFVLMGGALLAVSYAIADTEGGLSGFVSVAVAHEKFRLVNWDASITTTALWVVVLGNVFQRTSDMTADQAVVQRYLITGDVRKASRALWCSAAASIPWALIVFLLGTALFAFYKTHPERLNPSLQPDAIVPWFVVEYLPSGISGLVIAALFASGVSSLDSSIHSVATTISIDFYQRLWPGSTDHSVLKLARWLTVILGIVGTGLALLLATYAIESLWDLFLAFAGLAIGGLAGLFVLGIFTTRGNGIGAIAGAVGGGLVLYWVQSSTPVHFLLYPVIGVGSSFLIGYAMSVLTPVKQRSLEGLTIYE